MTSRLPSRLSQFEEAIGHWRGRRGSDGQSLVDCFQDEAAVEAPGEGPEVAREMFGRDGAVRGQEAVFDVGEHGIRPAEGGMTCGGAAGAGDVALVDDAGWSAMQQNHCPPSLTMVVPASTRAHSRLVSVVWNPRTTCRRAYRGRPSAVVSN